MAHCWAHYATALVGCRLAFCAILALAAGPGASPPAPPAAGNIVEFAPGLRIDWHRKRVEIDCKVVLREGPLEFVLCSPQTKEHESILVTPVRPLHIFQALGLIGLEPGAPPSYELEARKSIPARGAALAIQVKPSGGSVVPIEEWLWELNGKRPAPPQHWVFAGSVQSTEHGFAADSEGTIVAVVDFSTSLIALADTHTDNNDQLWLEARTQSIPPIKTFCTLIIQAEDACVLRLRLTDGRLHLDSEPLTEAQLKEVIGERRAAERMVRVDVEAKEPITPGARAEISSQLAAAGLTESMIRFFP